MNSGFYILVEGVDGSGKTTLLRSLETELSKTHRILLTKEPGSKTSIGADIRSMVLSHNDLNPFTQYLLFSADRLEHMEKVVKPALADGMCVIQDRGVGSSYAYQSHLMNMNLFEAIAEEVQTIKPDLVLILDCDYHTRCERLNKRNDLNHYDLSSAGDFEAMRNRYKQWALSLQNSFIIDASCNVDDVLKQCMCIIEDKILTFSMNNGTLKALE